MKVIFRCKQSGNCVSFTNEADIESMRKEPHYEEVKDESKAKDDAKINAEQENRESIASNPDENNDAEDVWEKQKDAKVLKKRGRPAKK